jgi:metal-sulfur cluster biosynthetic enzyme
MPAVKLDEGEESVTEVRSRTAQLPSREEVIQALRACYDPCCRDRKISVVDMGLIEGIEMRGRDVGITLVLTTGWCPFSAQLVEMIQSKVGALAGVETVDVEAVWTPAWTPERMSDEARSKLRLPLETLLPLREARLKGDAP